MQNEIKDIFYKEKAMLDRNSNRYEQCFLFITKYGYSVDITIYQAIDHSTRIYQRSLKKNGDSKSISLLSIFNGKFGDGKYYDFKLYLRMEFERKITGKNFSIPKEYFENDAIKMNKFFNDTISNWLFRYIVNHVSMLIANKAKDTNIDNSGRYEVYITDPIKPKMKTLKDLYDLDINASKIFTKFKSDFPDIKKIFKDNDNIYLTDDEYHVKGFILLRFGPKIKSPDKDELELIKNTYIESLRNMCKLSEYVENNSEDFYYKKRG